MNDTVRPLLIWLGVVSLFAFILFAQDKFKAKTNRWRVPEAALLGVCFCGGAAGGLLAMLLLHHKTRKPPFPWLVPLLFLLQAALLGWAWLS